MLKKDEKSMGRGVRRMPFRNALERDDWEPSREAYGRKRAVELDKKRRGKNLLRRRLRPDFNSQKLNAIYSMLVHLG